MKDAATGHHEGCTVEKRTMRTKTERSCGCESSDHDVGIVRFRVSMTSEEISTLAGIFEWFYICAHRTLPD